MHEFIRGITLCILFAYIAGIFGASLKACPGTVSGHMRLHPGH